MNESPDIPSIPVFAGGRKVVSVGVVAAAIGLVVLAVGWGFDTTRTHLAYLTAYTAFTAIGLGALAFLMIVHAMKAKWPLVVRRPTEALALSLAPLAVLFVPIAIGMNDLYVWSRPPGEAAISHHLAQLIEKKRAYLDDGFFLGRAAFYFASWLVPAVLLHRWSRNQDESGEASIAPKMRIVSSALLPLLGLSLTFAAFDWVMSLNPAWFSTMFGIYFFATGMLPAIAIITMVTASLEQSGWLRNLINTSHYYAMGRLLLTFVIFWAYVTFFQFFLIWIANKPEEVAWFIDRLQGAWGALAVFLIFGHFLLPFILLLSYGLKRRRGPLVLLSAWLFVMAYLHVHWMVVPSNVGARMVHWADFGALLFVGGVVLAFVTWMLRGRSLMPSRDPGLARALEYHSV